MQLQSSVLIYFSSINHLLWLIEKEQFNLNDCYKFRTILNKP